MLNKVLDLREDVSSELNLFKLFRDFFTFLDEILKVFESELVSSFEATVI